VIDRKYGKITKKGQPRTPRSGSATRYRRRTVKMGKSNAHGRNKSKKKLSDRDRSQGRAAYGIRGSQKTQKKPEDCIKEKRADVLRRPGLRQVVEKISMQDLNRLLKKSHSGGRVVGSSSRDHVLKRKRAREGFVRKSRRLSHQRGSSKEKEKM